MRYNIAISGVGGLGILTLGRIISKGALSEGKLAIMSEIHGLSQRYGSVFVHLRISDGEVLAPTIPSHQADLLIGLEPIETLRVREVIGEKTFVIMNANEIPPPTTAIGIEEYPAISNIIDSIKQYTQKIIVYNALEKAEKLGDPRFQNTILLGIASSIPKFPISAEKLKLAILEEFKRKKSVAERNIKAFELGVKIGRELIR